MVTQKKNKSNTFKRAQREDVKVKYPQAEEAGKLKIEEKIKGKRDRIVEMKEGAANKQKFFSTRNAFDAEEGLEPMESKLKKFETDSSHSVIIGIVIAEKSVEDTYVLKEKLNEPLKSCRLRFNLTNKTKAEEILSQRDVMPEEPESKALPTNEDDGLCQICFSCPANTVLLDCGHGSICLDCAIDSMKKNNVCIFCREKVVQIIEIEVAEIRNGLFKVLNSFYVSDG